LSKPKVATIRFNDLDMDFEAEVPYSVLNTVRSFASLCNKGEFPKYFQDKFASGSGKETLANKYVYVMGSILDDNQYFTVIELCRGEPKDFKLISKDNDIEFDYQDGGNSSDDSDDESNDDSDESDTHDDKKKPRRNTRFELEEDISAPEFKKEKNVVNQIDDDEDPELAAEAEMQKAEKQQKQKPNISNRLEFQAVGEDDFEEDEPKSPSSTSSSPTPRKDNTAQYKKLLMVDINILSYDELIQHCSQLRNAIRNLAKNSGIDQKTKKSIKEEMNKKYEEIEKRIAKLKYDHSSSN
jgi:hypothetical protein